MPVSNLAFTSNILAGSGKINFTGSDNTKFPFYYLVDDNTHKTLYLILLLNYLSLCVVSHFHQHPKENTSEEVGHQKTNQP